MKKISLSLGQVVGPPCEVLVHNKIRDKTWFVGQSQEPKCQAVLTTLGQQLFPHFFN